MTDESKQELRDLLSQIDAKLVAAMADEAGDGARARRIAGLQAARADVMARLADEAAPRRRRSETP